MPAVRPRLCIDFDDVIRSHDGKLLEGARESLAVLGDDFEIVIFSCRAGSDRGRGRIANWLRKHSIEVDHITATKVPAMIYLDDRALQFTGDWWQTLQQIRDFETWNERET